MHLPTPDQEAQGFQKPLLILTPSNPGWPEWPVGMAYVLASLELNGIPFEFLDLTTVHDWETKISRRLRSREYLAVASGGIIMLHRFFQQLGALVKRLAPGTPLVLGGNITKDADDRLLFDSIGISYGILGEAETSFPLFLRKLAAGETDFADSPGVIHRTALGAIVRNPIKRLDVAEYKAFPAWGHFDWRFYVANSSFSFIGENLRFMPILSGRGCVGKCGFCSPTIGGFRKRPIADVLDEIRHLNATYDFDTLCFLNEMFYPTAREVREFCAAYLTLKERKPWFVQVRIDANLDVETLRQMREAGCIAISAGIESGSDKILRLMNKKSSAAQIRTHFRNCREAGLSASGTYIVGYQDETEQDIQDTVNLLIEENINSGEALLFVYQGTHVYRLALERGLIADEVAHLDAISGDMYEPDAMLRFINLTAMPTPKFFEVASREVRRYNTHLFHANAVRNLKRSTVRGLRWTLCTLSGQCRTCGADLRHTDTLFGRGYLGFLGPGVTRREICTSCHNPIGWDIHAAEGMAEQRAHVEVLLENLKGCERIVVCGSNHDLNCLLRVDAFGLDYGKIVGIYSYEDRQYSWRLHYPELRLNQLADKRPDCLLCLDPFQDNRRILKAIHQGGGPEPKVLHVASPAFSRELWRNASTAARVFNGLVRYFGDLPIRMLRIAKQILGRQ